MNQMQEMFFSNAAMMYLFDIGLGIIWGSIFLSFYLKISLRSKLSLFAFLFLYSLAILKIKIIYSHLTAPDPSLFFLPLWFTLSFGPLLFFFVKFYTYPRYRFRNTDLKHFIFPAIQAMFYIFFYLANQEIQEQLTTRFIPNYYKLIEGILYIVSFFSYLILAFRYIKFKQSVLIKSNNSTAAKAYNSINHTIKIVYVLAFINSFLIILDYFLYHSFGLDLYNARGYSKLVDISFLVVPIWVSWFVFCELRKSYFRNIKNHIFPNKKTIIKSN